MILQKKIKRLISDAFGRGEISRDGINYAIRCPSCNDSRAEKKKLIIRLDDGRYHCWVCGIKGKSLQSLVRRYRPDLMEQAGRLKSVKMEGDSFQPVELPHNFIYLSAYNGNDPDVLSVVSYLKNRGLSPVDIARWRMLSCCSGSFRRRVIVPSFDEAGEINYYVARAIDDVQPKYRNAKAKKSEVIFNDIDIDWSKPIILVEGIFDAINSPENTIPILGSSLANKSAIFKKLTAKQSEVYLSLDPDMKDKSYKIAKRLKKAGCDVYISFAPIGRDLGNMTRLDARQLIQDSLPYGDMSGLYFKISQIKSGSIF